MNERLDPVARLLARAVLETTVDQLAIVGATLANTVGDDDLRDFVTDLQHPNVTEASIEEIVSKEKKIFQRKGNKMGGKRPPALSRLAVDVAYIQKVLEEALDEMADFSTFSTIKESVAKSESRQQETNRISEEEKSIRHEINDLKAAIREAKVNSEEQVTKENLQLARLKDSLLDVRRSTRAEQEFLTRLQNVREDEMVKFLEDEEKRLVYDRDELKRSIEYEQRVTLEMESWLSDRKAFLRTQHKLWTEKLKTDVANKDQELEELITAREEDLRRRDEAERRLAEATEYVQSEMARKEAIRQEEERVRAQAIAAVCIQSWWRMIMVKRHLGPYRRKKTRQGKQRKRKH